MLKKTKSAQPQLPQGAEQPQPEQPPMVVLTTRITAEERDQIRAAAGWGGLQKFVHDAVMAAVEKARKATK